MIRSKKYILQLALGLLVFGGCEKDYTYVAPEVVVDKNAPTVSYKNEIQPIFNASCAISGCHNGSKAPDLRAASSYTELITGGYINTANPTQSDLYIRITLPPSDAAFMPDGKPALSSAEITRILTWITQGAVNN